MEGNTYRSYFEIDENYFPQVTESAIEETQDLWKRTYPHETFLKMLRDAVRVMERREKRSIWISGAYGTGKSQCAYTLKKILDVPEDALRAYWSDYDALRGEQDLLGKLLGLKREGVVTAYRYAGTPESTRDLLFAVQESVQRELHVRGLYEGEQTLKDSIAAWLEKKPANRAFFDSMLQEPKWTASFGAMRVDEVIARLRQGQGVRELVETISRMAKEEGISMLQMDVDQLIAWLTDVMEQNRVKIVFLWDEFSDYFRVNRDSLADFQKLAELVNAKPFFFIPVTHETDSLFAAGDETWKKIRDRFVDVMITLPDNIAFDLIGAAFKAKASARQDWEICENDLNGRLDASRRQVMKAAHITSAQAIKNIMPLHPMAALVLKHIASAFQSNQRSMFDFIKNVGDERVKAFQYFIQHTGPYSDHPLLTVDQLWDFFYVRGKADLATHIRMILDTFDQQDGLNEDEQVVLKAILIMLAVDKQLGGGMDLLQPTSQNLGYVFEGDDMLATRAHSIALALKEKGILLETPLRNGQMKYDLAMLSGDQSKIDQLKKELRETTKTQKLVEEGELGKLLTLSPEGLKHRFVDAIGALKTATINDFTRTANGLADMDSPWQFHAIVAFAKDEQEAAAFRPLLKEAAGKERYKNLVFIDALATPLGLDAFERYVDFAAMAQYYQGNNNTAAQQQSRQARNVLAQEWKNRIYNGRFIVYTAKQPDGIPLMRAADVSEELCRVVRARHPYAFDLDKATKESYYKAQALKQSARCGITGEMTGLIKEAPQGVLDEVWDVEAYWTKETMRALAPAVMKCAIEARIKAEFQQNGQAEVGDLCSILVSSYGFPPCNLMAFLLGFFLRPYAGEPYRYGDAVGASEDMTAERLAEMIGNYVAYLAKGGKEPRTTFLVKMTQEERAFYKLTQDAWGIGAQRCTSIKRAVSAVIEKMREWNLPLWCLANRLPAAQWEAVSQYALLVQQGEGREEHAVALALGKRAQEDSLLGQALRDVLTMDSLEMGMRDFLARFADGALLHLADEIGAKRHLLVDIRSKFSKDYACLWNEETGKELLRNLLIEYRAARETNGVLGSSAGSWTEAWKEWRGRLRLFRIPAECVRELDPALGTILRDLLRIAKGETLLPEQLDGFARELRTQKAALSHLLGNEAEAFGHVYAPYLDGIAEEGRAQIRAKLDSGFFLAEKQACFDRVQSAATAYRRSQLVERLSSIWQERTGTNNPRHWAERHKMPALSCVSPDEFERARKAFDLLEHRDSKGSELDAAIAFLEGAAFFAVLADGAARDEAFRRDILAPYTALLTDLDEVREILSSLGVHPSQWRDNPRVKTRLREMAQAKYAAYGAPKVQQKIDRMSGAQLKHYLKELIKGNMTVGMEILGNG